MCLLNQHPTPFGRGLIEAEKGVFQSSDYMKVLFYDEFPKEQEDRNFSRVV